MRDFLRTASQSFHRHFIGIIEETLHALSQGGRVLFWMLGGVCVLSSMLLLYILNSETLVTIPAYGGSITEGLVGSPRFINPVLATSDSDHDLTSLIYSGLLKATPSGSYIPDLAESYNVSSDGLTYTVVLRPNATFQDGTPITADDVVFTIEKTQDSALKSPLQANWAGVTVKEVDQRTIEFILPQPYAPFIENLTMGILPKHLWTDVSDNEFPFSTLNTNPVGSGPFRMSSIKLGADGIPSSYTLSAFSNYTLGKPYLSSLTFRFYESESALESALKAGDVEAAGGISPQDLSIFNGFTIEQAPLTRVYGVFFNQSQNPVLQDTTVRAALSIAIDRNDFVAQVLNGYGTAINGPLPSDVATTDQPTPSAAVASARQMLLSAGWTPGANGILQKTTGSGKKAKTETLSLTLSTSDTPELRSAVQYLSSAWKQMGAQVSTQVFSEGDLSQNVIQPRSYDALLFGEVIGRVPDLYAFWASSQRNDPGLNIALYANSTADNILGQLRQTSDPSVRQKLYTEFNQELQKDTPAVFLYAPNYVYIVPNDLQGLDLGTLESPSDRFLSVTSWHVETDHIWPFFVPKASAQL